MTTKVASMRGGRRPHGPNEVRVDRATKWGNPFVVRKGYAHGEGVGLFLEAVEAYEKWLPTQPHLIEALKELRGKTLYCWCHPKPCHADVLARYADSQEETHSDIPF